MSEQNQLEMSRIFEPLMDKAVAFITEECSVKNLKKYKDMRSYLTALLALLCQISCSKLPIEPQK